MMRPEYLVFHCFDNLAASRLEKMFVVGRIRRNFVRVALNVKRVWTRVRRIRARTNILDALHTHDPSVVGILRGKKIFSA